MISVRHKHLKRPTPLERYGDQLGRIVERHRAEAALLAARQEAERAAAVAENAMREAQAANKAKTEFLANMSHELRSPLNAVIGFSKVMMDELFGPLGEPKYEGYVRDIHESGRHLLRLINDILDLAKIEAGKIQLDEQLTDVTETVRFCLKIISDGADTDGVKLLVNIPPDLPMLYADEQRLKQILINLLSNAVKFTEANGEVRLRISVSEHGRFVFEVSDTGIGMAEEDLTRVMEPFTQVDGSLSRKYEGTGLGLPITRSFMELHGGKLELKSRLGVGTTATMIFPACRTHRPPVPHTLQDENHAG